MHTPLQKWLQQIGVGSKRAVRELIRQGRVEVAGQIVTRYAEPVDPDQPILVDGSAVSRPTTTTVLLMNKPKKHLTIVDDQKDGPGLGRYLPDDAPRVFPVGRLDFNSEGALIWTDDGVLARRILHPQWSLPKVYGVKLRGHLTGDEPFFARVRRGMTIGETQYAPVEVKMGPLRSRATWVELTLREGKHRQIRKMCAAGGLQIVKLRRLSIGPIPLGDLNPRCVRALDDEEIAALRKAVDLE